MSEKHTIEQSQAMSDEQLAELTARLRGLQDNGYGLLTAPDTGDTWRKHPTDNSAAPTWNPAADISQAYGLLTWLTTTHGWAGWLNFTSPPSIELWKSGTGSAAVSGNDARAMCIAFVLAMEAING